MDNTLPSVERKPLEVIKSLTIDELHLAILSARFDHGDLERSIQARIAALPRIPLTVERWWSFPKAHSYPFGG